MTTESGVAGGPPGAPPAVPGRERSFDLARILFSDSSKGRFLWAAAAGVFFLMLGTPNLWGHEGTWALICREMMRTGDYVHPYLFGEEYYDKPLLSYWIMIGFAKLLGRLDEWALRLPGALAGLLTVGCTVRLGRSLYGRGVGLMAGWMLLGCCVFAYWVRVGTADILNIAAITAGAAWYFDRRDRPGFLTYGVFFFILAVGAQMKGLIAPVVTCLVILPDVGVQGRWKRHLRSPGLWAALLLGAGIYLGPFWASSSGAGGSYQSSGIGQALRESLGRYFQPFDHQEPFTVYVKYLPAYLLPWTIFLPFVIWRACRHWKALGPTSRWPLWASLLIFLFLTLSRSRRNYYLLPILPFLVLAVADWVQARGASSRWKAASAWIAVTSSVGLLVLYGGILPWVESKGGARLMAGEVRREAEALAPWSEWRVLSVSSPPHLPFYLAPPGQPLRINADQPELLARLISEHPRTVVVTPEKWVGPLAPFLGRYTRVPERSRIPWSLGEPKENPEGTVALILRP